MEDNQKLAKENIEVWMPYIKFKCGRGPSLTTFIYVSNFGNIKGHLFNNRPFTQEMIKLNNDGRRCLGKYRIFHLVWNLFMSETKKGYAIHHQDFNKLNDRLDNLVCITRAKHSEIHANNMSDKTKQKISENNKNKHYYWKGKHTKGSEAMQQKNKGTAWYNNGNKDKRFKSEIEAFVFGYFNKGRLCSPNKNRKFSEAARKNMSNAAKKRYNKHE